MEHKLIKRNEYKVGDTVAYVSNNWGDRENNPLWGGKYGYIIGKVIHCDLMKGMNPYSVDWDNGEDNTYESGDLMLVISTIKLPDELFIL